MIPQTVANFCVEIGYELVAKCGGCNFTESIVEFGLQECQIKCLRMSAGCNAFSYNNETGACRTAAPCALVHGWNSSRATSFIYSMKTFFGSLIQKLS